MFKKLNSAKKSVTTHVYNRRGRYAAGIAVIAGFTLGNGFNTVRVEQWNSFLNEHNLYEDFYAAVD